MKTGRDRRKFRNHCALPGPRARTGLSDTLPKAPASPVPHPCVARENPGRRRGSSSGPAPSVVLDLSRDLEQEQSAVPRGQPCFHRPPDPGRGRRVAEYSFSDHRPSLACGRSRLRGTGDGWRSCRCISYDHVRSPTPSAARRAGEILGAETYGPSRLQCESDGKRQRAAVDPGEKSACRRHSRGRCREEVRSAIARRDGDRPRRGAGSRPDSPPQRSRASKMIPLSTSRPRGGAAAAESP